MFAAWGSWAARFRWPVLAVVIAAVLGAGVWGAGVFGQLSEAGYNDPGSESTRAAEAVRSALGPPGGDVVVRRADGAGWARLGRLVLRRPVLVAVPLLAGLLVLAAPIRGVRFGETDERALPASDPARRAVEALKADFPALSTAGVQVVVRGTGGTAPDAAAVRAFGAAVQKVRGVAAVNPAGADRAAR